MMKNETQEVETADAGDAPTWAALEFGGAVAGAGAVPGLGAVAPPVQAARTQLRADSTARRLAGHAR